MNAAADTIAAKPGTGARAGRVARGWIDRSGPVRRVVKSDPVQDQIMTARALTVVRDRPRFLRGQLTGRGTARYELRRRPGVFHLRHGSGDVAILNKIFARDPALSSYEPPAEVAATVDATAAPRILDVGANIGLFGVYALGRWSDARITSFEPDPDNFRVLDLTVGANQREGSWDAVPAAVSDAVGELNFAPGDGAKSHLSPTEADERTITVPAVDFFDQLGDGVDLVKMDIEGGEWQILADPRLATAPIQVIRLEWHTLLCPQDDARAFAIDLLHAAGFEEVVDGDRRHLRNGVLWAWRG
ncbi:MAG TPA: FkbM family methyltransferase [Solirubrobacterales bacterium]